mmetsp:Transcript_28139/g.39586  ORF Transcript_28139/g.39586 Transcript_28139/m.39586 type:complete len:300 (-) Transcript_28139:69-968(-)
MRLKFTRTSSLFLSTLLVVSFATISSGFSLVSNKVSVHPTVGAFTTTSNVVFPSSTITTRTTQLFSSTQQQNDRQPWDAFRFVRQSSKFVNMPFTQKDERTIQPGDILWTPSSSNTNTKSSTSTSTFGLAPLDDVVMGGASSSTFDNNTGMWSGKVTDANNGGFIGIRSTPSFQWNMQSCQGIQLKLKLVKSAASSNNNKPQRFKIVVRDSTDFNGVCWTTSIDVKPNNKNGSGVTTVKVPFSKQVPTIFAKTVPDQTFQIQNVVGIQLAYSKFEYDGDLNPNFTMGDMILQILEMSAY